MKIRMLSTQRGAEDGCTVRTYEKGREYHLGHSAGARDLGRVFLEQKWAERVDEQKSAGPAPENKALRAPEDKGEPRNRRRAFGAE